MTSSQDTDWMSNIYVLTTTRILGVFGVTYLIKVSYQLYKTTRASDDRAVISGRSRSYPSPFRFAEKAIANRTG